MSDTVLNEADLLSLGQKISNGARSRLEAADRFWVYAPPFGDVVADEATRIIRMVIQHERCQAQKTSDPPQDCDWPLCGCDPKALRVVEVLQESGWLPPAVVAELERESDRLRRIILDAAVTRVTP